MALTPRHIQNMSEAASLEPHWGYADRALPCTNDPGSCEYLDVVYHSHDLGMYYTGIIWATIVGILLVWGIGRHCFRSRGSGIQLPVQQGESTHKRHSALIRLQDAVPAYLRRNLLSDAFRPIFGRTTRAQVFVLFALTAYLTIFSFVGIVYNTWVTPVSSVEGLYQTRSSIGPWSDRVGILAYALTPLSVMLSSRESILSLVTGLPYQSFMFLHQWLGYIIFLQSALHTIMWCVVEMKNYQPQPTVALEWIAQLYMIWGVIAMFFLTLLVISATPWGIRMTGYEFFRKFHYVLAMLYIGACWGHWEQLKCFLIPSLIFWFLDRGARFVRSALLHYNFLPSGQMGFRCATANIGFFPDTHDGDVVRLDFDHPHDAWTIGQHFYLCFPESAIWQSHPFTPLSLPVAGTTTQRHSYLFRAKKGETRRIAQLSARRASRNPSEKVDSSSGTDAQLSVILTGPYGEDITRDLPTEANVLCIAGGTGITYVLPLLLDLASQPQVPRRRIGLVWVVKHKHDIDWVAPELAILKRASRSLDFSIRIFITRAAEEQTNQNQQPTITDPKGADMPQSTSKEINSASNSDSASSQEEDADSGLSIHGLSKHDLTEDHVHNRPDLHQVVTGFVQGNVAGRTDVVASGPGSMISGLRGIVAGLNDGGKVWKGDEKCDVRLKCDDRLEW